MFNFFLLCALAIFAFGVPHKGDFLLLAVAALLYVTSATGLGLLISAFTRSQIAAIFGTAIATTLPATRFSGMIDPVARSMPQMGLLMISVLLPLQMLSGGTPPRESMPELVHNLMLAAPTTHFVSLAQAILYRGAGFGIVWPEFLALLAIGGVFFVLALGRFRKTIGSMT
jgi:ABC-type multidrug transport system permease subunit